MVYRSRMIVECSACRARFSVAEVQIPPHGRTVRCSRCRHEWHVEKPGIPGMAAPKPVAAPVPAPTAAPEPMPVAEPAVDPDFVPDNEPLFEPLPPRNFDEELHNEIREVTEDEPHHVDDLDPAFLDQLDAVIAQAEAGHTNKKTKAKDSAKPKIAKENRAPLSMKPFKIAVPVLAGLWLIAAFIAYFPAWSTLPGLSGIYHALGAKPTDGLAFSDVSMAREQEGNKTKFVLSGSIKNNSSADRSVPTVRVLLRDKDNKTLWGREYPVNAELKPGDVYPFRIANIETVFASSVSSIAVDMGNSLQLMVR